MKKVTLHIESYDETNAVPLDDEISVGRTDASAVVLEDSGLSRLNTSFFRDGDFVFVVDENSLNGTFVNGEKVSGRPRQVFDGDTVKIGSRTLIRIGIGEASESRAESRTDSTAFSDDFSTSPKTDSAPQAPKPASSAPNPKPDAPPMILFIAVGSFFLIIFGALAAFLIVSLYESDIAGSTPKPRQQIKTSTIAIPIRVVDPLGAGDIENLDDLVEAWEVQDAEFKAEELEAVTTSTDEPQLAVTVADWEKQRAKAMERRNAPVGMVSGVTIPPELTGSIGKQLAMFPKMGLTRDKLPRDFVSLAQKRMNNELLELPLATELYYLDGIGTSADSSPFNLFNIDTNGKSPLAPDSEGMAILRKLAGNYNGQKYDLNDPSHRLQMKRRLLRMFHPKAKPVLEEIARAYHDKFKRPLKITSLTRSLEYQVDLSRATSNAYRGQTPPHSTGMTFDMAYMHMTAEEQTFVMAKIAELERAGRVDALHERGQTPCIHIFVFP